MPLFTQTLLHKHSTMVNSSGEVGKVQIAHRPYKSLSLSLSLSLSEIMTYKYDRHNINTNKT